MRGLVLGLAGLVAVAQTYQGPLHFEVAAVKSAPRSNARPGFRGGPGTPDPLQVHLTDNSMGDLLRMAYGIGPSEPFRLLAPKWIEEEHYGVDATVPPGATRDQFQAMLEDLLIERFALKAHHETKTVEGYALQIAKSGARLTVSSETAGPWRPDGRAPGRRVGKDKEGLPQLEPGTVAMGMFQTSRGTRISARGQSLSVLLPNLENMVKAPVIDETSLNAKYDFNLTFSALDVNDPLDHAPNIFIAIEEQLGLRLTPKKAQIDTIVVEDVKRVPAEN